MSHDPSHDPSPGAPRQRITDDEFDAAQQEVDRRRRAAARADSATRAALDAFHAEWERLVAACSARRADDRERADVAIRTFAVEHGLVPEVARG